MLTVTPALYLLFERGPERRKLLASRRDAEAQGEMQFTPA